MPTVEEEIAALQAQRASGVIAPATAPANTGDGAEDESADRVALSGAGAFDKDIYGAGDRFAGFQRTVVEDDDEGDERGFGSQHPSTRAAVLEQARVSAIEAPRNLLHAGVDDAHDPFAERRKTHVIAQRESEYQARGRIGRTLSPERGNDAFSGRTPARSYGSIIQDQQLERERRETLAKIAKKQEEAAAATRAGALPPTKAAAGAGATAAAPQKPAPAAPSISVAEVGPKAAAAAARKARRWDLATPMADGAGASAWDAETETPQRGSGYGEIETPVRMGETPGRMGETPGRMGETPGRMGETPVRKANADGSAVLSGTGATPRSRWDQTPAREGAAGGADATPQRRGSRWDQTPRADSRWDDATPKLGAATPSALDGATPGRKRSRWDETPVAPGAAGSLSAATPMVTPGTGAAMATPAVGLRAGEMTPGSEARSRWEREMDDRNRPMTDEELDAIFPMEGYKVLPAPPTYVPLRTPSRRLLATPTPSAAMTPGFTMAATPAREEYGIAATPSETGLPTLKPEDMQYFGKLMEEVNEEELSAAEQNERRISKLLLKIKNGTPPQRKTALRQITDKARELGAGPLFNQILPLLMAPGLEDQERHLLVKVIDRILYKLDDLVRPYVHKILVVIEPLLIDEDYYARVEGREIISNLAKAAGLATMIATMRPDIDNLDEYVRNTTARAFAVVASALGIPTLLPFLKAVCQSRKSWQARHTGIKIVQQIAILMGCAVLPHLRQMVTITEHGLVDDQQKVRTITALALASLAEAAHPYGIESFDTVLRPLWKGIRQHRGKGLAAFLKAIGFIIPLMDANYANYYTREVMVILIREFQSPDEEMKKIVLKVVKQCVATDGVEPAYVREEILPEFFKNFWVRRMALDRRNYRQVVETTVELANKVGTAEIINRVVEDLKDENEPYRRMVIETIEQVVQNLGVADIDLRLEEQLIDGVLYAFQEQTEAEEKGQRTVMNGLGTVINALGGRVKPYLPQITGTIKWRLNNKSAAVRMQAADLIARIAVVMKACEEDVLMGHMGVVLYEYLGEEYPEVLGSILGALKAIVNVIGMMKMTPPIKDLLPRLTPILKNRHEKVQENCIDLVGRIADRGAEYVSAREWMRICFELLEMLKAHKKAIRRAAVNTFGYIAKAIGPQDVLHTLLNNLKVQERQNRVCTTVAIAIVAETCSPFTVVPALMNEYRVPELNVQNGVLKALSFMFEYIGEMGKDYIYAVCPLLEDALMDRDLVHRQTACTTVKHLSLGVAALGCEDAMSHLLNYVWPNIFEVSPHVINAVFEAIEGLTVALGHARILRYVLQGLFHPARRVREVYWKLYNSLYISGADALTAAYPMIEDDGRNTYRRTYLELFI